MSYVYVMKNELGLVKVGKSKNPEKRRKQLQNQSGFKVHIAHIFEHEKYAAVEDAAHLLLDAHRKAGEWFGVTVDDAIAAINQAVGIIQNNGELPQKSSRITGAQIRSARAALRISAAELAELAGVGPATIRRAEQFDEQTNMSAPIEAAVKSALEKAGLIFINGEERTGVGITEEKWLKMTGEMNA